MKTPIFNDIIRDGNSAQLTEGVRHTPLVSEAPQAAGTDAVDTADLPPQFAAAIKEQQAQEAIEQAQTAQSEAEAMQMQLYEQQQAAAMQPPQPEPVQPVLDYEEQAELLVTLSDSVQQLAFSKVAEKRYFTADERKTVREIKNKQRKKEPLTDEEKQLYDDWTVYLQFKDLLPYEEKEAEMLRKPLAKVLEQQQSNLDPKTALLLAALMVAAPRVASMAALKSDLNR